MKNRILHLVKDWSDLENLPEPSLSGREDYPLPRGVNMLLPVELCIHREVLVTLLTASIQEIHRHRRSQLRNASAQEIADLDAALKQQLSLRRWAKDHPSSYICIALYPVLDGDAEDDSDEDPGEEEEED